ncbi:hypothetical protein [Lysinibacillus sp. LZ02]|uniref:hypothetical protein n=1 Tax=Lysinibacillus sp. LZ02 TaxID=3420668 RepID=UPI003D360B24
MPIQTITTLYPISILVSIILSTIIGYIITKKSKDLGYGFFISLVASGLFLFLIVDWFSSVAKVANMGTTPFLLNIISVITLYPVYVLLLWVVLKKIHKAATE